MHMEAGRVLVKETRDNWTKDNRIDHHLPISIFKMITENHLSKRIKVMMVELMLERAERSQEMVEGTAWTIWNLSRTIGMRINITRKEGIFIIIKNHR